VSSCHGRADRGAHRDAGRVEALETKHIDPVVIRRYALAVSDPMTRSLSLLLPQDLFHRLSLGELVDQLVEVAYVPHQRIFDFV